MKMASALVDDAGNDDDPAPLLHVAAEDNDLELARRLLQQPCVNVNEFWESETALHVCCRLGHVQLAQLLISHGANSNYITEHTHESPLVLAAREGHLQIVKLLVERGKCLEGPNREGCGLEALYCTAVCGWAEVLRYLIQQGVPYEEHHMPHGHTPLTCACRHGRLGVVQELISLGADVNKPMNNGHSGVFIATLFQLPDIVKLLVQAGADVNGYSVQFQGCPLHIACTNRDMETLHALLEVDCDINVIQDKGQTPLFMAAELGFLDILDTLLEHGADPDVDTLDTGNTPLFACLENPGLCVAGGKPTLELVRHLVASGCDVDHENRAGVTPLQAALDKENCDVAMLLLSADCRYHAHPTHPL